MSAGGNNLFAATVVTYAELSVREVSDLAGRFGLNLKDVADGERIPGSYWGEPEAGLIGDSLYCRGDTPAHSVLHEMAHYVCMSARRRAGLHTDAGGSVIEECAVCYLQILVSEYLTGFGRERAFADMDAWGYSFREGSAAAWFNGDGKDARLWLQGNALIETNDCPAWRVRA